MFSVLARGMAAVSCPKMFRVASANLLPVRTFQSIITQSQGKIQNSTSMFKRMNTQTHQIPDTLSSFAPNMIISRGMNRNARRPTKSNHGKRPV